MSKCSECGFNLVRFGYFCSIKCETAYEQKLKPIMAEMVENLSFSSRVKLRELFIDDYVFVSVMADELKLKKDYGSKDAKLIEYYREYVANMVEKLWEADEKIRILENK